MSDMSDSSENELKQQRCLQYQKRRQSRDIEKKKQKMKNEKKGNIQYILSFLNKFFKSAMMNERIKRINERTIKLPLPPLPSFPPFPPISPLYCHNFI